MTDTFEPTFRFRQFAIDDRRCGLKIGTDGVMLGAWACCPRPYGHILDVGAGSGLIALMMAQRYPGARITAVELDGESAKDMRLNIAQSPWPDRIEALECDFRSAEGLYDLIVSNPPFFTTGERAPEAARALARHAGALSPVSLIHYATRHLSPGGRLSMVIPVEKTSHGDTCSVLETEAAVARLALVRRTDVSTSPRRGVTRSLMEFSNVPGEPAARSVIEVGSDEYKELTSQFYL